MTNRKVLERLIRNDELLISAAGEVIDWRTSSGLDGLVSGLQAVIINV